MENSSPVQLPAADDDVVVIKKHHLLLALLPIMLVVGAAIGVLFVKQTGSSNADINSIVATQVRHQLDNADRVDVSLDDDPSIGNSDALVTIVEFSEFQCPYCGRFRKDTFKQLLDKYGDKIRFVSRDFPLTSIHPEALPAAEAAQCIYEQDQNKYWDFADVLFQNQTSLSSDFYKQTASQVGADMASFETCVSTNASRQEISKDFDDGRGYGVQSTPSFFVNGKPLIGAQPIDAFVQLIDAELARLESN